MVPVQCPPADPSSKQEREQHWGEHPTGDRGRGSSDTLASVSESDLGSRVGAGVRQAVLHPHLSISAYTYDTLDSDRMHWREMIFEMPEGQGQGHV